MEDRGAVDESLKIHKHFPDFFSVLLPELGRPQYLEKCLDSIHKYADMPVEIIVHDDGSGQAKQEKIVAWRDKISTLILNHGHNTGLSRSFNRCRAMASSPYLVGFNTDTYMTSPFLSNMKAALDLPYVGMVNVVESLGEGPGVHVTAEGVKVGLSVIMGEFHACGIRAEVWDEIGGWNEQVPTNASDLGAISNIFAAGYFSVRVEGTVYNEMWNNNGKVNIAERNKDYVDSWVYARDDANVPRIFGIDDCDHTVLCRKRWMQIYAGVNEYLRKSPHYGSWYNPKFVTRERNKLFRNGKTPHNIDREFAKTYGHDKWKDRIISDFNL